MAEKKPTSQRFDFFGSNHKNILLAEDNEGDIEIFKTLCEESTYPCSIFTVNNGEDVMTFLKESKSTPDIIILDINMPRLDGHETLRDIKSNKDLKNIPVIMLSSSTLPTDISNAQKNGANGYIKKPLNFDISELLGFIEISKGSPETFLQFTD